MSHFSATGQLSNSQSCFHNLLKTFILLHSSGFLDNLTQILPSKPLEEKHALGPQAVSALSMDYLVK